MKKCNICINYFNSTDNEYLSSWKLCKCGRYRLNNSTIRLWSHEGVIYVDNKNLIGFFYTHQDAHDFVDKLIKEKQGNTYEKIRR